MVKSKLIWLCLRHVQPGMYDRTGAKAGQIHKCAVCKRPAATLAEA